jgi:hypothetical protein
MAVSFSINYDGSVQIWFTNVPRASATNLFNTLVGGGSNAGGISVSFSSEEPAKQIVAFEYRCLLPGRAPADAARLMTLMPRRSGW